MYKMYYCVRTGEIWVYRGSLYAWFYIPSLFCFCITTRFLSNAYEHIICLPLPLILTGNPSLSSSYHSQDFMKDNLVKFYIF